MSAHGTRRALPNGARLVVVPPRPGVVAATVAVPLAGVTLETAACAPAVAARWAAELRAAARAEDAVVRVDPVSTPDAAGFTVEALDPALLAAVPRWFRDAAAALPDPLAPPADPRAPADDRWSHPVRRALFGSGHRYGLTPADRARAAQRPGGLRRAARALAAVPPVLAAQAEGTHVDVLAAGLAALDHRGPDAGAGPPAPRPAATEQRAAAYYVLGLPGVALGAPTKCAHHVAWSLLGGREGMLDRSLRLDGGLTYSLAAFSRELAEGGYAVVYAACAPGTAGEVADRVQAVLDAARGGVPAHLVRGAAERLVVAHHAALETGRGVTERAARYEAAGLSPADLVAYPSTVDQVTAEEVAAALTTATVLSGIR
ncbi:hypothetical protein GCM10010124_28070 [Pilimelia terevasa]|uniref:Peptidase M16 C-terminal domain-containing protein n=1 Tax=Pilimelia terevasa TaxID=53372 RepID=A0A8J3FIU8_9ACTN|nr:insulinase family protein [Pilimelia terevasa]GGK33911.1 hypothetical protein GCM10010124_28070 [Pilimelia terevasa]